MAQLTAGGDIIKQGYTKIKSRKLGVWKKKWVILRKATSKGPSRLERYPDENTSMLRLATKYFSLADIYRVTRLTAATKAHALALVFHDDSSRMLSFESELDVSEWLDAFRTLLAAAPLEMSNDDPEASPPSTGLPKDTYHVYLLPSHNLDFSGECLLHIDTEAIILRDNKTRAHIVQWRLNSLRKYGQDDTKFVFESGRSSETGEGLFIFNTVECKAIYHKVRTATTALAEADRITRRQESMDENGNLQSVVHRQLSAPQTPARDMPDPPWKAPARDTPDPPWKAPRTNPSDRSKLRDASVPVNPPPPVPTTPPPPPPQARPSAPTPEQPPELPPLRRPSVPTTPAATPAASGPSLPPPRVTSVNGLSTQTQPRVSSTGGATAVTSSSVQWTTGAAAAAEGAASGEKDYIYEEKYLSPQFRDFLAGRKEEPGSN